LNTNIKAVFFDIGGTLVEKTKNQATKYHISHGNDPAA